MQTCPQCRRKGPTGLGKAGVSKTCLSRGPVDDKNGEANRKRASKWAFLLEEGRPVLSYSAQSLSRQLSGGLFTSPAVRSSASSGGPDRYCTRLTSGSGTGIPQWARRFQAGRAAHFPEMVIQNSLWTNKTSTLTCLVDFSKARCSLNRQWNLSNSFTLNRYTVNLRRYCRKIIHGRALL